MRKASLQEVRLDERMPIWALRFAALRVRPVPHGVASIATHVIPPKVTDVVVRGVAIVVTYLHVGAWRIAQECPRHKDVNECFAALLPRNLRVTNPNLLVASRMFAVSE